MSIGLLGDSEPINKDKQKEPLDADLINAVMHYLHCSETPDIPQSAPVDVDAIEAIVRRIMEEEKEKPLANSGESSMQVKRTVKSEQIDFGDAAELLGKDGLQAIANTMAQFRR